MNIKLYVTPRDIALLTSGNHKVIASDVIRPPKLTTEIIISTDEFYVDREHDTGDDGEHYFLISRKFPSLT